MAKLSDFSLASPWAGDCNSTIEDTDEMVECDGCDGKGRAIDMDQPGWPSVECSKCKGTGLMETQAAGKEPEKPVERYVLAYVPEEMKKPMKSSMSFRINTTAAGGQNHDYYLARIGETLEEMCLRYLRTLVFPSGLYKVDYFHRDQIGLTYQGP